MHNLDSLLLLPFSAPTALDFYANRLAIGTKTRLVFAKKNQRNQDTNIMNTGSK